MEVAVKRDARRIQAKTPCFGVFQLADFVSQFRTGIMRFSSGLLLVSALTFGVSTQANASVITMLFDHTESFASGVGGVHQHFAILDGFDHSVSTPASYDSASATTTTNYSQPDANTVLLSWSGSQTRNGEAWIGGDSFTELRFTADQNAYYDIDGIYSVESTDLSQPGRSRLSSSLYDATLGQYLFYRQSDSQDAIVEHLMSSQTGIYNGSQTGALLIGHEYWFSILTFIDPYYASSDGGARGVGSATFTITANPSTVPEPASLSLLGTGALGLVFLIRRRVPLWKAGV